VLTTKIKSSSKLAIRLIPQTQKTENPTPDGFEALLNTVRERIEGVFHELQNTGCNLERLLAKLVKHMLRLHFGIVQTFQVLSDLAF